MRARAQVAVNRTRLAGVLEWLAPDIAAQREAAQERAQGTAQLRAYFQARGPSKILDPTQRPIVNLMHALSSGCQEAKVLPVRSCGQQRPACMQHSCGNFRICVYTS
jgi:hypothetical protein